MGGEGDGLPSLPPSASACVQEKYLAHTPSSPMYIDHFPADVAGLTVADLPRLLPNLDRAGAPALLAPASGGGERGRPWHDPPPPPPLSPSLSSSLSPSRSLYAASVVTIVDLLSTPPAEHSRLFDYEAYAHKRKGRVLTSPTLEALRASFQARASSDGRGGSRQARHALGI